MDRRQYLGAAAAGLAVGVVGVGGYSLLSGNASGPQPVAASEYPPYPDADEYELSGNGATSSDPFQLRLGGPTIITADHSDEAEADTPFYVRLESTTTDLSREVVRVGGPYVGTTAVQPVPEGEYELVVTGTPERDPLSWEATVYDVPVYDDTGLAVPIEFADGLDAVIGPINFGDISIYDFSFSIDTDTESKLQLIDREGNFNRQILRGAVADEYSGSFPAGGVGYVAIDTNTTWTFSLEQSDEELPDPNTTANQSASTNSTNQTDSTNSTNESA